MVALQKLAKGAKLLGKQLVTNLTSSYKSTGHCAYSAKYHIVFCPEYRRKVLSEPIAIKFESILKEVSGELEVEVL